MCTLAVGMQDEPLTRYLVVRQKIIMSSVKITFKWDVEDKLGWFFKVILITCFKNIKVEQSIQNKNAILQNDEFN